MPQQSTGIDAYDSLVPHMSTSQITKLTPSTLPLLARYDLQAECTIDGISYVAKYVANGKVYYKCWKAECKGVWKVPLQTNSQTAKGKLARSHTQNDCGEKPAQFSECHRAKEVYIFGENSGPFKVKKLTQEYQGQKQKIRDDLKDLKRIMLELIKDDLDATKEEFLSRFRQAWHKSDQYEDVAQTFFSPIRDFLSKGTERNTQISPKIERAAPVENK